MKAKDTLALVFRRANIKEDIADIQHRAMKQDIYYKGRIYKDADRCKPDLVNDQLLIVSFEEYLSTLTSYPYTGNDLKDGQVVVEGNDYEVYGECGFDEQGSFDNRYAIPLDKIIEELKSLTSKEQPSASPCLNSLYESIGEGIKEQQPVTNLPEIPESSNKESVDLEAEAAELYPDKQNGHNSASFTRNNVAMAQREAHIRARKMSQDTITELTNKLKEWVALSEKWQNIILEREKKIAELEAKQSGE
jgi:hypothetical protein